LFDYFSHNILVGKIDSVTHSTPPVLSQTSQAILLFQPNAWFLLYQISS
jgi:hypothetical protein